MTCFNSKNLPRNQTPTPSTLKATERIGARTHALTVHLHPLLCGIFLLTLSAGDMSTLQKQRGGDRRRSWLYRCRTGAVMRCRTGCCSWKSRPPFSASVRSSPLLSSPPPPVTPLRYFSVHLTSTALPPFTSHGSGSLGESPWQPIHSDYVM